MLKDRATLKQFPLAKVFHLIEPGPVLLMTTFARGRANIMTLSWHMMVEFVPPLIACVVSPGNFSFRALRTTGECVLALPGADLARVVVDIGNCSGREVEKFHAFGLTPHPARKVAAPLVAECLANLECRVIDTRLVRRYCLFVLEAVQAWTNPERREKRTFHANGDGTFVLDGRLVDLKRRMVKWKEFL